MYFYSCSVQKFITLYRIDVVPHADTPMLPKFFTTENPRA